MGIYSSVRLPTFPLKLCNGLLRYNLTEFNFYTHHSIITSSFTLSLKGTTKCSLVKTLLSIPFKYTSQLDSVACIWKVFDIICIHIFHSSMTLQLFVRPLPLLQFRRLFYTVGRTLWTGDQPVAIPLPTRSTTQRQNINAHTDFNVLSGIRTHNPRVRASEDSSCLRPRGNCDRLASGWAKTVHALDRASTVIGLIYIIIY
jgi:hypothetical protein